MPPQPQHSSDPLTYDDSSVLRNKFGIRDQDRLDYIERTMSSARIAEGIPDGNFDLEHLQAIHKHIFQDVYEWAGELRESNLQKGNSVFMPANRLEMGMADVHIRLQDHSYLKDVSRDEFATQAGIIIGDINHLHPFREGNGRTQLQYLQKLGDNAGFDVALERINPEDWIKASIESHEADYKAMQECIHGITSERDRFHDRSKSQDRGRER